MDCIHPVAQIACVALLASGAVYVLVMAALRRWPRWPAAFIWLVLLIGAIWLGSLHYSPLGFGSERLPLLGSIEVRRPNRAPVALHSGEVITVKAGSPVAIHPALLAGPVDCLWSASAGGALDDLHSCDTAYAADARAPFEVLRLRVRSACGLPPVAARIKVSILP